MYNRGRLKTYDDWKKRYLIIPKTPQRFDEMENR